MSKFSKIVKKYTNCQKLWKVAKTFQKCQNCQKISKLLKLSKSVKVVKNCQKKLHLQNVGQVMFHHHSDQISQGSQVSS